jgi:hypothetical protein
MDQILNALRTFEIWIYALIGLGALYYIRKFALAWQELRGAAFGLERDNAQARLNQAASVLVLLVTMAVAEFVLVSFIAPTVPGAIPLLTPTLDLLVTPSITLPATLVEGQGTPGAVPTIDLNETPQPEGCIIGQVEITSPKSDDEVSGLVTVLGTVDIPNFAFYKLESKRPDEGFWAILLAGNLPVKAGELGIWDTRRLTPGEYQLSVVPVTTDAETLPRCAVNVRVALPAPDSTSP